MKRLLPLILFLLCALPSWAENIFVDSDCGSVTTYNSSANTCTGGSERVYGTITNALAYSSLGGSDDDHVMIRAGTYSENATMSAKSGTSGHPVVIEAYSGESVILNSAGGGGSGSALSFVNTSYVTVKNLSFVGTGRSVPWSAIRVQATTGDVTGFTIDSVTVTGWGNNIDASFRPINMLGFNATAYVVTGWSIKNCIMTDNMGENFRLVSVWNGSFTNNIVTAPRHSRGSGNNPINVPLTCGVQIGGNSSASGNATSSSQNTFSGNTFATFPDNTCTGCTSGSSAVGIHADVSSLFGTIQNNTFKDIAPNSSSALVGAAINIESRCDDWIIRENVIMRTGGGIVLGSTSKRSSRNQVINNTIYGAGKYGILIECGADNIVRNNAVDGSGLANVGIFQGAIDGSSSCPAFGNNVFDYNGYWDTTKVGRYGNLSVSNFSTWKSQCSCDSHALNADPKFLSTTTGSENFHMDGTSTYIDAGQGGLTIGAYPTDAGSGSAPPSGPPISINAVTPVGGEFFLPGQVMHITWQAQGASSGFVLSAFGHDAASPGENSTAGSGQTEIWNAHQVQASLLVQYGSSKTANASWASSRSNGGIAMEISGATPGGTSCTYCEGAATTNQTTWSPSFASIPTGSTPYVAIIHSEIIAGVPPPTVNAPTLTGTGGWNVTWTEIGHVNFNQSGGTTHVISAFIGVIGSSPSSGNLTWAFAGQTQARAVWAVIKLSGGAVSSPIVQSKTGGGGTTAATSLSITLDNNLATSSNLKLELTRDNGTTYETIASSVPNTGSYDWTVTAGASSSCKVRVSAVTDVTSNSSSLAAFRVRGQYSGANP